MIFCRGKRYSVIAETRYDGLCCYCVVENAANLYTFLLFICNNLLPSLGNKRYTIIVDNCKIHKHAIIKNILEYFEHTMIFLPAYCPHLNPIENHFQILKKRIKKYSHESPLLLDILK